MSDVPNSLVRQVEDRLASQGTSEAALLGVLDSVLQSFGCALGTLHDVDPCTGALRLVAQRGVPGPLLPRIGSIPIGKGMAGIAAERREPVQVCNLQTDQSGVAKPAAKETQMEGSLAVPALVDGRLCGVLGVAKPVAYTYSADETALLLDVAAVIGKHLPARPLPPHGQADPGTR